jgi:hypothetical protein
MAAGLDQSCLGPTPVCCAFHSCVVSPPCVLVSPLCAGLTAVCWSPPGGPDQCSEGRGQGAVGPDPRHQGGGGQAS